MDRRLDSVFEKKKTWDDRPRTHPAANGTAQLKLAAAAIIIIDDDEGDDGTTHRSTARLSAQIDSIRRAAGENQGSE
jgi:hypothetical protein